MRAFLIQSYEAILLRPRHQYLQLPRRIHYLYGAARALQLRRPLQIHNHPSRLDPNRAGIRLRQNAAGLRRARQAGARGSAEQSGGLEHTSACHAHHIIRFPDLK
jgi:hypothetical protein